MSDGFNIENRISPNGITREQFLNSEYAKQLSKLDQIHLESVFDQFNTTKAKFTKDDVLDTQEQAAMISFYKAMAGEDRRDLTVTQDDYNQNVKPDQFGRRTSYKDYENFMKSYSSIMENESNTLNARFFRSYEDEYGRLGVDLSPDMYETYQNGQRDSIAITSNIGDFRVRTYKFGDGRFKLLKMSSNKKAGNTASLEYHYSDNPKPDTKPVSITGISNREIAEYYYDPQQDLYSPDNGKTLYRLEENGLLTKIGAGDVDTPFQPATITKYTEVPHTSPGAVIKEEPVVPVEQPDVIEEESHDEPKPNVSVPAPAKVTTQYTISRSDDPEGAAALFNSEYMNGPKNGKIKAENGHVYNYDKNGNLSYVQKDKVKVTILRNNQNEVFGYREQSYNSKGKETLNVLRNKNGVVLEVQEY